MYEKIKYQLERLSGSRLKELQQDGQDKDRWLVIKDVAALRKQATFQEQLTVTLASSYHEQSG